MIAVFDYGAGNLRSVENTLAEIGCEFEIVRDAAGLDRGSKIILPGVGHFGQMMRALSEEVKAKLKDRIAAGVPFLGICLGMQALYEASEEAPEVGGLGLFRGVVKRFPAHARCPHMGWNELDVRPCSRLLPPGARPYVYFAHSYYVPEVPETSAVCTYEVDYTAALESGNVFGGQFHQEKSGPVGLEMVRRFVEMSSAG
jgi:imidazole glycerol phosphate synthase glutamine amidotransferase subunit